MQLSDEVVGQVESAKPCVQIQWDGIEFLVVPGLLLEKEVTLIRPFKSNIFSSLKTSKTTKLQHGQRKLMKCVPTIGSSYVSSVTQKLMLSDHSSKS